MSKKKMSVRQQQALEAERKRIAGDLHDGIGQSLTTLKVRVENALIHLESKQIDDARDILSDVVLQLRSAISDVRRIATELRPAMLDDLGLKATLNWLSRQFQAAHTGIQISLELDVPEENIPVDLKIPIFRMLQEALNNIAKHANADTVFVYLRLIQRRLIVGIVDNGAGFETNQILSGKFCLLGTGVNSMRERVESTEGVFKIRSKLGSGTAITAEWGYDDGSYETNLGLLDRYARHDTAFSQLDVPL